MEPQQQKKNTTVFMISDKDDCITVVCQNGGTCLDAKDSFTCNCVQGYGGKFCESMLDVSYCV